MSKTVELYAELPAGWHELPASTLRLTAMTIALVEDARDVQRLSIAPGSIAVKITVELPENPKTAPVDATVKGVASVFIP